ncbi:hypothetical protein CFIMG_008689RA00001 [Ceratocystis fimbriata CBS 114723]|uniref:Centromere protein Scm3 n=1 Tax=Ceratocystis fimbriata CBS 114723 TaxID=1035309 RepID=A0A2C5X0L3_9PEZI|nr:hypothetical protein CFIMG_008689RA00001 [Ceratocystis fimbriata CBS 114723]
MEHILSINPASLHSSSRTDSSFENEEGELMYEPESASEHRDPGTKLAKARDHAAMRLKSTFEHIFEKYERDFTGIGDEIDLRTGEIVVDNGHLTSMRHERDTGDGLVNDLSSDKLIMPSNVSNEKDICLEDLDALGAVLEDGNKKYNATQQDPNDNDNDNDDMDNEADEQRILNSAQNPRHETTTTTTPQSTTMILRSRNQAIVPAYSQTRKLSTLALRQTPRLSASPLTFGSAHGIWGPDTPRDPLWKVPEINISGFKSSFAANLFQAESQRRYILPVHTGQESIWAPAPREKLEWATTPRKLIGAGKVPRETDAYKLTGTPDSQDETIDDCNDGDLPLSITRGRRSFKPSVAIATLPVRARPQTITPNLDFESSASTKRASSRVTRSQRPASSPCRQAETPTCRKRKTRQNCTTPGSHVEGAREKSSPLHLPNSSLPDTTIVTVPTSKPPKSSSFSTTKKLEATTPSRRRGQKVVIELPKTPSAAKSLYVEIPDDHCTSHQDQPKSSPLSLQGASSSVCRRILRRNRPPTLAIKYSDRESRVPTHPERIIPDSEEPSSSIPKSTIADSTAPSSLDAELIFPTDHDTNPEADFEVAENGGCIDKDCKTLSEEDSDKPTQQEEGLAVETSEDSTKYSSDEELMSNKSLLEDENDETVIIHPISSHDSDLEDGALDTNSKDENSTLTHGHCSLVRGNILEDKNDIAGKTNSYDSENDSEDTVIIHRQSPCTTDSPANNPNPDCNHHSLFINKDGNPALIDDMPTASFSQKPTLQGTRLFLRPSISPNYNFSDDKDGFVIPAKPSIAKSPSPTKKPKNVPRRRASALGKSSPIARPSASYGKSVLSKNHIASGDSVLANSLEPASTIGTQSGIIDVHPKTNETEPNSRLSHKKRKRTVIDEDSNEEPEPPKIDVEEWFKPQPTTPSDKVPWKRVRPSPRTYTRKGQRSRFGLKVTSFSSPVNKASVRSTEQTSISRMSSKSTVPTPVMEETEESELYMPDIAKSPSIEEVAKDNDLPDESYNDLISISDVPEIPSSPSRLPHIRRPYEPITIQPHNNPHDGDTLEPLPPTTPRRAEHAPLTPSASKRSFARRAAASMALDPDEDELSVNLRALMYPNPHLYASGSRKRKSTVTMPETPSSKRRRPPTSSRSGFTGHGTGSATVKKRVSAASLARLAPPSPTPVVARTPGGTLRRCGEDGFRCHREFCFSCVSI